MILSHPKSSSVPSHCNHTLRCPLCLASTIRPIYLWSFVHLAQTVANHLLQSLFTIQVCVEFNASIQFFWVPSFSPSFLLDVICLLTRKMIWHQLKCFAEAVLRNGVKLQVVTPYSRGEIMIRR